MNRKLLMIPVLALLLIPSLAFADADVRQDSCVAYTEQGVDYVRVWFSVINFSLPTAVRDLHLTPQPPPVLPECLMLDCTHPAGWSCNLNPLGGAEWFANTPNDCIAPGTIKSGFSFLLDPGFCCYVAQYTDATGAVILEEEVCFCDKTVGVEQGIWGNVKKLYR